MTSQLAGMQRLYYPKGVIQIINRTSRIRDARWLYALPCLQYELSQNFAKYWGIDYDLEFVGRAEQPNTTNATLKMWLLDTSDMQGALGYHTVGDDGQPYGRVFVIDDMTDGVEITVTLDHELKELAADPSAERVVGPDAQGRHFAIEPCDAVEDDRYGHFVVVGSSTIKCSNFVTPRYYGLDNADGSDALDFQGTLKPDQVVPALLPGGYQEYAEASGAWHSINARLEDGNASTRAKHSDGRSAMRAAKPFASMTIMQSRIAVLG